MGENRSQFHQARWNEPVIMEIGVPGARAIIPPQAEQEIRDVSGHALTAIPEKMRRTAPPELPELSQAQVLRHYLRLSQGVLGADLIVDIGQGTCTMKYSPKINESFVRNPKAAELHPYQHESTVQGMLQIMWEFEQMLKEISGMDRFTFQPGGGSQAIYTNACIIRAYHESRGEKERDEIITTIFSHPVNAACPRTAGFKVITLYPGEKGYPEPDALKKVVSECTAGLMITNPEDTGIYNPHIEELVRIVHDAGGLCAYDQANANGIMGITRARDAGFDMCHFNLHKTFSSPHGCGGPGSGAVGVTGELARFLPVPCVGFDGSRYYLDYNVPESIGKVRGFYGVIQAVLRSYAWVLSLGPQGLREVAEAAVLNSNYLLKKMLEIPGVSIPYPGQRRLEQVRYSLEKLTEETGVTSEEIETRVADFGNHYWTSHHPYLVPEPCTFEPTESYSREDMDSYVDIIRQIASEAYTDPSVIKNAPHNSVVHRANQDLLNDPKKWAVTWRAYVRKHREGSL